MKKAPIGAMPFAGLLLLIAFLLVLFSLHFYRCVYVHEDAQLCKYAAPAGTDSLFPSGRSPYHGLRMGGLQPLGR